MFNINFFSTLEKQEHTKNLQPRFTPTQADNLTFT